MRSDTKAPFSPRSIAVASAIALLSAHAGAAVIVADGKLDSTDGLTYALGYTVGFIDDTGQAIGDGKLYFGINAGDNTQFLYFQMPLAYVDNRYGDYTKSAFGWGKNGHTFDQLLGSDSLGNYDSKKGTLGFGWNGNSVDIDYIGGVQTQVCDKFNKDGSCSKYQTVTTSYRSGGAGTWEADGVTEKNDGKVNFGNSVNSILEIATSLEWNFFNAGSTTSDDGHSTPNWIAEVGYEIQFAAGTFNAADWLDPGKAYTLITLGNPHVSPSKKTFGEYGNPTCIVGCTPDDGGGGPNEIPEPASLALIGIGLGAMGWAGRRRRLRGEQPI